jgi:transposase InsO family protein
MATDPDVRRAVVESLAGLTGRARAATVRQLAATYAVSPKPNTAWPRAAGRGVRAPRADRGRSGVPTPELLTVAATVATSKRLDGDVILPVCDALELLRESGRLTAPVSRSTVYRHLRAQALSVRHLRRPTPFRYRASAHPNAEWQLDASNCVQYFLDDQGLGERDIALQLHRNHPAEFRTIKRELLRYLVVDHASGMFYLQYRYAAGETAADTLDVLTEAILPKAHPSYQFHGVPFRLLVDQGSLARAKLSQQWLALLQIELVTHLPGNPRAKGLVEWGHKFALRFEARLKLQRPRDLAELNRWAYDWSVKVCTTWPYRVKTSEGLTRQQRWLTIPPAQLRIPRDAVTGQVLDAAALRRLLRTGEQRRKVDGGGRFSFEGRWYAVPDSNAWRDWVWVRYHPYEFPAVEAVWRGEAGVPRAIWRCQPLAVREDGWLEDTARPGTIRRPAATVTQRAQPELERVASETFGVTWTGTGDKRRAEAPALGMHRVAVFGREAEAAAGLVTLPQAGTPLPIADPEAERRLTLMQLLGELHQALGRWLTPEENARVRQAWPEGVPLRELGAVIETFTPTRQEDDDADRTIAAG